MKPIREKGQTVILGGGLTGLSAGCVLAERGDGVTVIEADSVVGGLSKTIVKDGFRFDLGGHRFFTTNQGTVDFVTTLMGDELVAVSRKSKIFMRNRYFDYPLKAFNAMFGLGIPTTMKIMSDYGIEKARGFTKNRSIVSLEDWVVANFGRKMFSIYFKEYSEKVWGIPCSRVSAEWVSQRINGLSLAKAVRNALFKLNGRSLRTLTDTFLYPRHGIGRISERLRDEIEKGSTVLTDCRVTRINHSGKCIESVEVSNQRGSDVIDGGDFIATIPLTHVVRMLHPVPPHEINAAAASLRFRDLVIVTVMLDRRRVTDQTWIYIPERHIPFGRIHEPTNWSEAMAPEGKTLLVTEYFSFMGDDIWREKDHTLVDITIKGLRDLGLIRSRDVIDSAVVRVPKAYPLFEVGYREICERIYAYLEGFENLHLAGRSGMFRYLNMDHAIESGMATAQELLKRRTDRGGVTASLIPAVAES